jgi:hypothetical protein
MPLTRRDSRIFASSKSRRSVTRKKEAAAFRGGFPAETKPSYQAYCLCRPGTGEEVHDQGNDGEQQQEMNHGAGYVEHQKAACPENQQQQSNHEERSESH